MAGSRAPHLGDAPASALFAAQLAAGRGLDARRPIRIVAHHVGSIAARKARELTKQATLTRAQAVAELFGTLTNRLAAIDVASHVGLLTFGDEVAHATRRASLSKNF